MALHRSGLGIDRIRKLGGYFANVPETITHGINSVSGWRNEMQLICA